MTNTKCYVNATKYFLAALNIIFMAFSILAIVVGADLLHRSASLPEEDLAYLAWTYGAAYIIFAIFMILLSLLGSVGALKENVTMLSTYAWILSIILFLEGIIVICTASDAHSPSLYIVIVVQIICTALSFILSSWIQKNEFEASND